MNTNLQTKAAEAFAARWKGKGYEKGDTQRFWLELLQEVYGVTNVFEYVEFEDDKEVAVIEID